jgi:glutaredoxin 3
MSVTVYSTNMCPYCVMVKDWLKSKNVSFEEINVGVDKEKAREMIEQSGQSGVPVVKIEDVFVIGFDRPKLDEVLKLKNVI